MNTTPSPEVTTATSKDELLRHTATIVASFVGHNTVSPDAVPGLLNTVYDALSALGTPKVEAPKVLEPAVPIKKSVFPDYIICLEDGKKLKMLKRHLQACYGMTIEDYRARWNLPANYPMVAPNYAEHRSKLARDIGLGKKIKNEAAAEEPKAAAPKAPSSRGRSKKS